MLQRILTVRESRLGAIHTATAESYHILGIFLKLENSKNFPGLLHRYMKSYQRSKDYTEKALSIFVAAVGGEHPSTIVVKKSLATLDQIIKESDI